jgi:hypothetical protein
MRQVIYGNHVRREYPNAINIHELNVKYLSEMYTKHKIDVSRLVIASCLCSDEVNMPNSAFNSSLAGPFFMGGLAGLPFTGLTGIGAFAHHIPDNGASLIFYGPHIGITDQGELGMIRRARQDHLSSSCGALMAALGRFQDNSDYTPEPNPDDYQQYLLEMALKERKDDFLNAENPVKAVTDAAYEIIHEKLMHLLKRSKGQFGKESIAMLGGVMINTERGLNDYFDVRYFQVIRPDDL